MFILRFLFSFFLFFLSFLVYLYLFLPVYHWHRKSGVKTLSYLACHLHNMLRTFRPRASCYFSCSGKLSIVVFNTFPADKFSVCVQFPATFSGNSSPFQFDSFAVSRLMQQPISLATIRKRCTDVTALSLSFPPSLPL